MSIITKLRNRVEKRIAYVVFRTFLKQDRKLALFESYNGEDNSYSCNPKALYERMLEAPECVFPKLRDVTPEQGLEMSAQV